MKKILTSIILFVVSVAIISFTVYTLMNMGMKEDIKPKKYRLIEEANEIVSDKEVSNLYHIYLNENRHKFKVVYYLEEGENSKNLKVIIYFDGKTVLDEIIKENVKENVDKLWKDKKYYDNLKLEKKDFNIIKSDQDYLAFSIANLNKGVMKNIYVIDDDGKLIEESGLLKLDSSVNYVSEDNKKLDIFYDENIQDCVKIEDNKIYYLNVKEDEDKITIEEEKIIIQNHKFKREVINTYLVKKK